MNLWTSSALSGAVSQSSGEDVPEGHSSSAPVVGLVGHPIDAGFSVAHTAEAELGTVLLVPTRTRMSYGTSVVMDSSSRITVVGVVSDPVRGGRLEGHVTPVSVLVSRSTESTDVDTDER